MCVALFIDEMRMTSQAKSLSRKMEYGSLRSAVAQDHESSQSFVYFAMPSPDGNWQRTRPGRVRFLHWLKSNGFLVREFAAREYDDSYDAEVSVPLALDVLDYAQRSRPKTIAIASDDPSLASLCERLRLMGVQVEVYGVRRVVPYALRDAADRFVDIEPLVMGMEELVRGEEA